MEALIVLRFLGQHHPFVEGFARLTGACRGANYSKEE